MLLSVKRRDKQRNNRACETRGRLMVATTSDGMTPFISAAGNDDSLCAS